MTQVTQYASFSLSFENSQLTTKLDSKFSTQLFHDYVKTERVQNGLTIHKLITFVEARYKNPPSQGSKGSAHNKTTVTN